MRTTTHASLVSLLCLALGVFFLLPFAYVHGSTPKIVYQDIRLSDLNPAITGDLGEAKISVPSSVIAGGGTIQIVEETWGYISVDVYAQPNLWLDTKNNFMTRDGLTRKAILVESTNKTVGITTSKKGIFQGSKSSPTLVRCGLVTDITVVNVDLPNSKVDECSILIYDPDTMHTIHITLSSSIPHSKINQKIWKELLKSVNTAKKKETQDSKKTSQTKSSTYTGTYFTMKLPKEWSVSEKDMDDLTLIAPNLGASLVASSIKLDTPIDYDPELRSVWLNAFLSEFERRIDDFVFISSKDVKIDGLPGLRIDYTGTYQGLPIEGYLLVTIKTGVEYIMVATVLNNNQWKNYQDVMKKTFASFKRKK